MADAQAQPEVVSNSIVETVDGPDKEPSFGAPEAEVQSAPETPDVEPEPQEEAEVDPHDLADKLMEALTAEEQAEEGDEDPEGEEGVEGGGRAAKTIRGLRQRAQQVEAQLGQVQQQNQAQLQQFQQYMQQMEQQNLQLRESLAHLTGRVEAGPQRGPVDPNDPDYLRSQFKNEVRTETQAEFDKRLQEVVNPLQQRLDQYEQQRAQQARQEEIKANSQRYQYMADRAVDEYLLRDMDEGERKLVNRHALGTEILNLAYGMKTDIASAAKMFRATSLGYARAAMKAQARKQRGARDASANAQTPSAPGRGTSNARGQSFMTKEQAQEQGFKDELEAQMSKDGLILGGG